MYWLELILQNNHYLAPRSQLNIQEGQKIFGLKSLVTLKMEVITHTAGNLSFYEVDVTLYDVMWQPKQINGKGSSLPCYG